MNEMYITSLLLFVFSASASALLYWVYLEYAHEEYLNGIRAMLSQRGDANEAILRTQKRDASKSIKNRIKSVMRLAGFRFSVWIFFGIYLLLLFLFSSFFVLFLQHYSGVGFGLFFGSLIFYMLVSSIILHRKKSFNSALAIAISVLVKMMKNGVGFEQAIVKAVDVSNSKMFKEIFAQFFKEKNTIGEDEAFANINRFVNSKELLIFALAVKIGRASGGRFSNTLEKVEKTIQYRKKMQQKVDVITREGSIGSYIVALIAVFLYFALDVNFDGKLHDYFMTSKYGRFQLLAIFVWIFLGLVANKFVTRIEK
ncbi:MAG: hypothetical protein OEL19_05870 [Sulfurimonas sp.]|nr:hypothetical protein [Sulfurimonas sp.]